MSNVQRISGPSTQEIGPATDSPGPSLGYEPPTSLVPAPATSMVSGDAVTQLAALLEQLDAQDRGAARDRETVANAARSKEDAAEVDEMHHKADDIRTGGWTTGLMDVGAGVAEIGAGFASFQASSASSAEKSATDAMTSLEKSGASGIEADATKAALATTAKAEAANTRSDLLVKAAFEGGAKGLEGGKDAASGQYRGMETDDDADAKVHANTAGVYDRTAKAAHDDGADAKEALNKVLEWAKEMQASQAGAQLTAAGVLRG